MSTRHSHHVHPEPQPESRFRQPRLPEGAGRFRAHPHPAAGRGLRHRARPTTPPTWWWSTPAASSIRRWPNRWTRSARRWPRTARSSSPAAWASARSMIREAHPGVLSISGPQDYGSVMNAVHAALPPKHDPFIDLRAATTRHQADAEALRLPEDFRRLQPPLQLLHHPVDARRPGLAPGRRGAARSREAGDGRREGTAGDLAGHRGLRRRREVRRARMARQVVPDAHEGAVRRPVRARPVDAPALRLSVSARRRHHPADGRTGRSCRTSTSRSSTPARASSS